MTSSHDDFKKRHLKSPEVFDRAWLEWFREEFGRQLYRIELEPSPDAPFKIDATSRVLPNLAISASSRSPMRTSHRGHLDDDLSMLVVQAGDIALQFGGEEVALTGNMATLGRNDVAATLDMQSNVQMLSIRLRRQLIEPLVQNLSDLRGVAIIRDKQALRLLLGYIDALDQEEALVAFDTQHLVTTHVHELAAMAFGMTSDALAVAENRGVRAARLAAVKMDILSNLHRPDLSVTSVAARQGVTPRYVYTLLETEGATFSEYVIAQRLMRAHRMLSDPRFEGHSINSIALSVGFGDLSYFNRSFRRRYGATPSDVRGQASGER
jgi:AraC-like DNA-binding protein